MEHLDIFLLISFDIFIMAASRKIGIDKGNRMLSYIGFLGLVLSIICMVLFLILKVLMFFIY